MMHTPRWIVPIALVLLLNSCPRSSFASLEAAPRASAQSSIPVSASDHENCLRAAQQSLGKNAEVLRCGYLDDATHLEAVVAIRVPGLKDDKNGVPISRLMILRQNGSEWDTELKVDKEITNNAGYVGINFIYDSDPFLYYRASFTDQGTRWGARTPSQFTLILLPMNRKGKIDVEDMGTGVGWNPAVGRFQEVQPNGEDFAPEVKNPKHIQNR